jgi:hypothetical protein
MLNPSVADEVRNDPTIRKCQGFQARWGHGGSCEVVNLFALRATDPRELSKHPDPVGAENDEHLRRAADEVVSAKGRIVVAWGAHRFARRRAEEVRRIYWPFRLDCLGTTKDGSPRHPLYVPYSQPLVPWEGYR